MNISDFLLDERLSAADAIEVKDALQAALDAMASYGSDPHYISIISLMYGATNTELHRAIDDEAKHETATPSTTPHAL